MKAGTCRYDCAITSPPANVTDWPPKIASNRTRKMTGRKTVKNSVSGRRVNARRSARTC
jgi:hypothetical protein